MVIRTSERKERLTVSLSRRARDFIRAEANESGTDQSAVVEDALVRLWRERRREATRRALLADWDTDEQLAEELARLDPRLPSEDFSDWPGWEEGR